MVLAGIMLTNTRIRAFYAERFTVTEQSETKMPTPTRHKAL